MEGEEDDEIDALKGSRCTLCLIAPSSLYPSLPLYPPNPNPLLSMPALAPSRCLPVHFGSLCSMESFHCCGSCYNRFAVACLRTLTQLCMKKHRGSWVEIVEVGMVGSGFIKTGAVLSWEGVQYCGTPGFQVTCPCGGFLRSHGVLLCSWPHGCCTPTQGRACFIYHHPLGVISVCRYTGRNSMQFIRPSSTRANFTPKAFA